MEKTIKVLYEDKFLVICVKPVGILSQEDEQNDNMVSRLKEYYSSKGEGSDIFVVHRLDRNVGGVMVFARQKNIAGKLSALIQERIFVKEYFAVINGVPNEQEGVFEDLLFKDSSKNKTFVVKRMRKGVKDASLNYKIVRNVNEVSLVRIHLNTGRTHQIRVQFASRKMPLLGDGKYGSRDNKCDIALWACRVAFIHPITKKQLDFEETYPKEYPWNIFEN